LNPKAVRFIWPDFLWGLLALPLLVALYVWLLRRRRRNAVRYASLTLVRQAIGPGQRWRRHVPPALLLVSIAAGLVAAARPAANVVLPADYMTIVLAIDVSRSMLANDVEPNRIHAAQVAAREFIRELPDGIRVGIVTFAGSAQVVQGVTDRKEDLLAAIDRFQLQRATATGSGLLVALATLMPEAGIDLESLLYGQGFGRDGGRAKGAIESRAAPPPPKAAPKAPAAAVAPGTYTGGAMVLLSDGRRTNGPDPVMAARKAAELGVRVYTVGFGTPNGSIPGYEGWSFYVRLDEEALKAVAKVTEAEYFYAGSAVDLRKVYQHLTSRFALERRDTEIGALFAAASALLGLLAFGLSAIWFRRSV
jgi:Ca-activated chloride channel family protein